MYKNEGGQKMEVLNLKNWKEEYQNKGVIKLIEHIDSKDIDLLKKFGIEINDKIYTKREIDVIQETLCMYEKDEDGDDLQLPSDITRGEFECLYKKIWDINSNI